MKFQFFLALIGIMCVAVSDAKWCNITNEDEVRAYKSISGVDFHTPSYVAEFIPVKKQMLVCCQGYKLVGMDCVPSCQIECTDTQVCVEPNVCGCRKGYHLVENNCEPIPICEQECGANAYCSAPGVCQCKTGFSRNEAGMCQSWCKFECRNGDCIGPNNCACHQGFVKVDGLCIPDCESGCKFGDCKKNGMCICWPGFVYNSMTRNCDDTFVTTTTPIPQVHPFDTTTTPIPQVHPFDNEGRKPCPDYCPNGNCTDGVCKCPQGLIRVDWRCASHCSLCQFGQCVEENVCKTHDGLISHPSIESELNNTVSTSSESPFKTTTGQDTTCATGCWAGTCVSGVCQCTDGLILSGENECIRPCEAFCKNGICTQDNSCECQPGYILKSGTECVPVCTKACENGFCMAPDQCECYEGYILNTSPDLEHVCLPTCDSLEGNEGCLNGTCVAVNKCECVDGLINNPENRFECIPYPVDAEARQKRSWYIYVLLGVLILLLMIILFLLALRKFHQDTYNVDKVEKHRATVQYQNCDQSSCVV